MDSGGRNALDLTHAGRRLSEDGFVALGPVLDAATVATLGHALDGHLGGAPPSSAYGVLRNNIWRLVPAFEEELRRGELARIARELLGLDSVRLFQDHVVWKTPETRERVEWHQDFAYWPLEAPAGLTLWIALDEADEANGCLHYIPGTHRGGERAPQDFVVGATQPLRSDLPPLDGRAREHEAVSVPVRPGEAIAHDPLVWHMSPGNASGRDRRAWTISWVAPGNRWDPGHAPHPFNFELKPTRGTELSGPWFPVFTR